MSVFTVVDTLDGYKRRLAVRSFETSHTFSEYFDDEKFVLIRINS